MQTLSTPIEINRNAPNVFVSLLMSLTCCEIYFWRCYSHANLFFRVSSWRSTQYSSASGETPHCATLAPNILQRITAMIWSPVKCISKSSKPELHQIDWKSRHDSPNRSKLIKQWNNTWNRSIQDRAALALSDFFLLIYVCLVYSLIRLIFFFLNTINWGKISQ